MVQVACSVGLLLVVRLPGRACSVIFVLCIETTAPDWTQQTADLSAASTLCSDCGRDDDVFLLRLE